MKKKPGNGPGKNGGFALSRKEDRAPALPDAEKLFTTADIARLKVDILTSTDPARKVEALRKIALSLIPEAEKAALFLRGLADADVSVRSEAVKCLKQLGLNADVADTIRELFEGTQDARRRATERLASLVKEMTEAEKGIVFLVLTDSMTDEAVPLAEALHVVEGMIDVLSERADHLEKFTRHLVARLAVEIDPEEMTRPFIGIFREAAVRHGELVLRTLTDEFRRCRDRRVRGLLLRTLWIAGPPPGGEAQLLEETIAEALRLDDATPQLWDIAGCLVRAGEAAAVGLVQAFEKADEEKKIVLTVLLDRVCVQADVSKKARRRAAETLLDTMKVAGKRLSNRIMECEFVRDPALAKKTRREFVKEFVKALEGASERLTDAVFTGIVRMGEVAAEPLMEISRTSRRPAERNRAVDLLGRIVGEATEAESPSLVDDALSLCVRHIEGEFPGKAAVAVTLGRISAGTLADEKQVKDIADLLLSKLGTTSYSYEAIEGLGHTCAGPKLSLNTAVTIAEALLVYFGQDLPEMKTKTTTDGDRSEVYLMGIEVSAYTVMVPLIIAALEKLCLNTVITPTLRNQILEALLAKWRKVVSWEEIWGPGNTTALAGALERIGCSEMADTESKLRILDSLSSSIDIPSVFQALARICLSEPDSAQVDEIAEEAALKTLKAFPSLDDVKREEREVFLPALGMLAARPNMARASERSKRSRRAAIDLLFDGLKENIPGVTQALAGVLQVRDLPEKLRTEITDRLRAKGR